MEKVLLIDDEQDWLQTFEVAHEEIFNKYNLELISFQLKPDTTIDEIINLIADPEISLVLLDEKLDKVPGIAFKGEDIVDKFRRHSTRNIAIYIISNSISKYENNYDIDGSFNKGGISNPQKEDYVNFQKEIQRFSRAAIRVSTISTETLARISELSKKKILNGSISPKEDRELEGLREQIHSQYPHKDNEDRTSLLKELKSEQESLTEVLKTINSKLG